MDKKLIMIAAPPACGKNYVSEMICNAVGQITFLDKDDLAPLLYRAFDVCGEKLDLDGAFYGENLRDYEYETLLKLAFSTLRFSDLVLVNAPFSREVRDEGYMRQLKARAEALGAKLILIWVHTPTEVCYRRMKARNSIRDTDKLQHWEEYVRKINYNPPEALVAAGAVDGLVVFENENDQTAKESLRQVLEILGECV